MPPRSTVHNTTPHHAAPLRRAGRRLGREPRGHPLRVGVEARGCGGGAAGGGAEAPGVQAARREDGADGTQCGVAGVLQEQGPGRGALQERGDGGDQRVSRQGAHPLRGLGEGRALHRLLRSRAGR